jgi:hypothetical protein
MTHSAIGSYSSNLWEILCSLYASFLYHWTHCIYAYLAEVVQHRVCMLQYESVPPWKLQIGPLCKGGFEYFHRSPASRRRRRKGSPVRADINTGTCPTKLRETRIWVSKMWSWVPRDSDLRLTALARASSNCKWQAHSFVREDVT